MAFALVFPNEGASTSSSIKLVCVITRPHYGITELSHLERQSPCLQSRLPLPSSHFKPHRALRVLNVVEDIKNTSYLLFSLVTFPTLWEIENKR